MNAALTVVGCFSALLASSALARPPLIDVHVHTQPDRYPLVADKLAANGITRFINLSGGTPGRGLEEALRGARDFDGRILVCANLSWSDIGQKDFADRQVRLLEQAQALGARCLKIHKALGLFLPDPDTPGQRLKVDDPRLDPIWAAAGRLKMPIFIHTGDPKAFFEPATPQNERWAELKVHPGWSFADAEKFPRREALLAARDRVVARHRGTVFIGVHFANNPEDLAYVDQALSQHPNLYVDIAARVPEIGRHDPEKVRAVFIKHADRILFGTDLGFHRGIMLGSSGKTSPNLMDIDLFYHDHFRFFETADRQMPHPTPIQGDWRIDGIQLPPEVLAKVYSGNALRLFWGVEGPQALDAETLWLAPGYAEFME